jgi:hypothetical protein
MKRYIAYLCGTAAALLLVASPGRAQTTGHDHGTASASDHHAMMMAMMADMQAKQKKLDDLVARMNAATGQEKIDRMAALLTEMASMHEEMCSMMMRGGMTAMMPMPHDAGTAPSPAPESSGGDHAEHHQP